MRFVQDVITQHKNSSLYEIAVIGDQYDRQQNTTIAEYERTITTIRGEQIPDRWSPNHKMASNFFYRFITQLNQFLLGNGVTWENDDTAKKLGEDFDTRLQELGRAALVGGIAFGYYNRDHMEVFKVGGNYDEAVFAPLVDVENGALKAGVRFWQIAKDKPTRATLYEIDGYTEYLFEPGKNGEIIKPKTPYVVFSRTSEVNGTEIYNGKNYDGFPIIPLWGNPHKQSEIVGIRNSIDCYDLIKNGFANDLDTAQIYWIIKNAGGMSDVDLAKFMDKLVTLKMATADVDQDIQPVTVNIPHEARERLLDRIERDLYKDFGALNIDEIKGGAVTATQIEAAYEPLNTKADQYEYCVLEFLNQLLKIAGIEGENPTFTRSKLINVNESVQTVLQAAAQIDDDEYTTRKILTILGDGDKADEILKRRAANEMNRISIPIVDDGEDNEPDEPDV